MQNELEFFMNSNKILAGIVTFNPNIKRFAENLSALISQVQNILVLDNGSDNVSEIRAELAKYKLEIDIICFDRNKGIAAALSQIMDYADAHGYQWLLSLDQDSVIKAGLADCYLRLVDDIQYSDAGIFTCLINDRNFKDEKYEIQKVEVIEVPYCISSAALTSVEKYKKTNGYDKNFFIDCVDFDLCYSLREHNYKIYRVNHIGLLHEVGHGENKRFLWKNIIVYHQPSFRIYYLARNTILMHKKHKKLFPFWTTMYKIAAQFVKIILYENNKIEKLRKYSAGLKAGLSC